MTKRIIKCSPIGIGEVFGRWVVIGVPFPQTSKATKSNIWFVPCQCTCGTYRAVRVPMLKNRHSGSCGDCERVRHGKTHGESHTRMYKNWAAMKQRCHNPKSDNYKGYGGRGIVVCDEWRLSYEAFRDWANRSGYKNGYELDRRDNDSGYCPANCRWVTGSDNKRNTRQNVRVSAFGETRCIEDWALDPRCSVSPATIKMRINKLGMTPEVAIVTARRTKKSLGPYRGSHGQRFVKQVDGT